MFYMNWFSGIFSWFNAKFNIIDEFEVHFTQPKKNAHVMQIDLKQFIRHTKRKGQV